MATRDQSPPLTPAVLHVLMALSGDAAHGYGIMQAVSETAPELGMGPGTIYGCLGRLEDDGFVETLPHEAERRGEDARRRYYRLTPAGRERLVLEAARVVSTAKLLRARGLVPQGSST